MRASMANRSILTSLPVASANRRSWPLQSGQWTGRAFIRGGRKNVRQALYMPALVAIRFNPDLQAIYQRFKAAGKASKLAITAIVRKLVVLANGLLRDARKWQPLLP